MFHSHVNKTIKFFVNLGFCLMWKWCIAAFVKHIKLFYFIILVIEETSLFL